VAQINQLSVTSGSVSLPNSGSVAIFSNVEDNGNLYIKTSAGVITSVGSTSGGGSGSSGTSGTGGAGSGSSGTSGTGISGSSGTSGTGVSGSAGTSGTSGSGSSGTSGTQGATGTNGTSGTQGVAGSSGTSGTQGVAGSSGTSGTQGATGTAGSSGTSGTQGVAGSSGTSGTQGATGTGGTSGTSSNGTSGTQGATGTSGTSGATGTSGTGGAGTSGTSGATGTSGSSGSSGTAGGTGSSGTSGTGGAGGGVSTVYNNTVRYTSTSGSNIAQLMSNGTVYAGISWSRSTTTLTITSTSHGLTTNDYVLVRNMSVDYSYLQVTVSNSNVFTVTVPDSGDASGTAGTYIPALRVTTLTDGAVTFTAPSAGNVQLISCAIYINASETDPKTLTVPSNAITNGAGSNASLASRVPPNVRAYNVGGANSSWLSTATVQFSTTTNHNIYNISGGLGTFGPVLITLNF
jgi:hypothetical protein